MCIRDRYVYEPGSRKWSKIAGNFPVMAGTAIPYEKDKIILLGGVEEILPTSPEHPGFSRKLRVISTETNSLVDSFCLLYTSDAADDLLCVELGGRRIIKKKKQVKTTS